MKKYIKRIFSVLLSTVTAVTAAASSFPISASALDGDVYKKPIVVVSLGDSFSAGEGIEEFYDQNLDLFDKVKSDD